MEDRILLAHGSGGKLSHQLIEKLFFQYFPNPNLVKNTDAALVELPSNQVHITTDAFVVNPLFFPGGDIGKLAVSGTVNDLAVSGSIPRYLTVSFILEEGLPMDILEKVVQSMQAEANKAGVFIISGDTKVVDKGSCDKLFISTTGLGIPILGYEKLQEHIDLSPGDLIILNGTIADHGMAVFTAREKIGETLKIKSDVAPLNHMLQKIMEAKIPIKFMRDATRGGIGTVLNEIVHLQDIGIEIREEDIPLQEPVKGLCEMMGFDPLHVANEGKVVMVIPALAADAALELMQKFEEGRHSRVIGEVIADPAGMVLLKTQIGGRRIVDMLAGEQLPRIC
ncbi:MAG: hydrogenase expression/formation protein HypE [Candidatus Cyclobacteriaceae bacterium M3_2C_046]